MDKNITIKRANSREQRVYYFDFLRVFATFAVVILHLSAQNWDTTDVKSFAWNTFNFYDSIVRWALLSFVMISGALFLQKDIPLKKIFSKYIFRIVTAFLFWSFVYAVEHYAENKDIIKALDHFISGHYHLWFLFMITELYMILPFTKKIVESDFLTKYFLLLAFIFTFFLPQSVNLISVFSEKYGTIATYIINNFYFYFVMGFTVYFLLGCVLNKIEISKKQERIIYFLGICGFIATILMSIMVSRIKNKPNEIFYSYTSINVLFESIAVFVFFKKHFSKQSKFIVTLSKYSFGAYLVHAAVIRVIELCGLNTLSFNPIFSVPVISVMVFVISFAVSGVLNHIPILKKYIV